jgi:hypothetical protein
MKTTLLALLLGPTASIAAKAADLALRYDQPATSWMREAVPIGNGYMGAMLFGGVDADQIQFSEIHVKSVKGLVVTDNTSTPNALSITADSSCSEVLIEKNSL